MQKWLKISLISLAVLAILFLLGNIGVNWWLKENLPDYIRKNSDYEIKYSTLDVDLGTGNILATKIAVKSKNPENRNVIGVDGTVDSLKISRLGIYDAVFNKKINTSDLLLVKPRLKVTLAKPVDNRTGKERNPLLFKNLKIKDGDISMYRHTKQKFLSVNDLMLDVTNLQLTEKSVEQKLPVVFDKYDINGRNFYFRPDNVYALTANVITTKNGLMDIQKFRLVPLLTYDQFIRYYPKKRNLFDFNADQMTFKDIVMKNNKIALSNVTFQNPEIKMFTTSAPKSKTEKDFTYDVNLQDVQMNKAKVEILNPDKTRLFAAETLNLNVSNMRMDRETAKGNIPFSYEKFLIGGNGLNYITPDQEITVNSLSANPKSVESRGIMVKPKVKYSSKPLLDFSLNHIFADINSWKFEKNRLSVDVQNLVLDALNGKFTAPESEERKKFSMRGIQLPLKVRNITVKNSNLTVDRPNRPLVFNNLYANVQNLEMNSETVKKGIPFKLGTYNFTTKNFSYRTEFYNMSAGLIKFQKGNFLVNNFAMKPTVSRAQFIRMIPVEKDLYDIAVNQITGNGNWDLVSDKKFMNVSQVLLNGVKANIFRSKIPKDDPSIKPMYSELLRSIKFPLTVGNLDIKNSVLEYEEDTKQSEGPGKLVFGNFSMNVKNLNSGKSPGKPTAIPITIKTSFMNASPMNVKWNLDTAKQNDAFSISGNISDLPASRINPFIEPYLKVRATGAIENLIFNFNGTKTGLNGVVNMKHKDLKVSVLKKDSKEKNKVLSAIVNMVVRTNSKDYPETVTVDNVKRDPTKSFFNLFWQGIQEGLKKTLIGKNIENTEQTVKTTVTDAKAVGKGVSKTAKEVKEKIQTPANTAEPEKKEGFLKRVFRKKDKEND